MTSGLLEESTVNYTREIKSLVLGLVSHSGGMLMGLKEWHLRGQEMVKICRIFRNQTLTKSEL